MDVKITKCPPGEAENAHYLRDWAFERQAGVFKKRRNNKKKLGSKRAKKFERKQKKITRAFKDSFYATYEWRQLRYRALKKYGSRCLCCGRSPKDGATMHVDHIKPRKQFPELAFELDNLQVLCAVCNHGKGNWDSTDWRPK